jgi:hypothetical protein
VVVVRFRQKAHIHKALIIGEALNVCHPSSEIELTENCSRLVLGVGHCIPV